LGFALVGGLASAAYSAYLDHDYSTRRAAYDRAETCLTVSQIASCRYVGDARIVRRTMPGADPRVELTFVDLPGPDRMAYLYRTHIAEWNTWQEGSVLKAELWHGTVTMVAGVTTLDNPDTLPYVGPAPSLIFLAGTLALAGGLVWFLLRNVRPRRQDSSR